MCCWFDHFIRSEAPNWYCSRKLKPALNRPGHPAFLSTALDLVDLSEPGESSGGGTKDQRRRSPVRRKASSASPRRHTRPEGTELIQVEVEHLPASPRTPERISLDSGTYTQEAHDIT